MSKKEIVTDENLLERIQYPFHTIPVSFYEDHFDEFLNGEIGCHWHNEFEFAVLTEGEAECWISREASGGVSQILKAGDGMFVNSRGLHRMKQRGSGAVLFDFVIPVRFFQMLPVENIFSQTVIPILNSRISGQIFRADNPEDKAVLDCIRALKHTDVNSPLFELSCLEKLCRLWECLYLDFARKGETTKAQGMDQPREKRLRTMLGFIHDHFAENISIEDIAQSAGVSRSECFRCFRLILQKTPAQYLSEYRLAKAADMLTGTDKKLLEICFACGFNSLSYFGKMFKRHSGKTPQEYRDGGQKDGNSP